jgi:pheromone shutdown protein TraB
MNAISALLASNLLILPKYQKPMKLMRFALIGAAVAGGIYYYLNNRDKSNSIMEDLADNATDLAAKAKDFAFDYVGRIAAELRS